MSTVVRPFTGVFELDPVHSSVQFAVPHIVSTFRASFADIEGRLAADDSRIKLTAIARVESISIIDPPEFRDHVVRGEDFFQAGAHPEMTFSSTDVELRGDGSATVMGELTIRGIGRTSSPRARTRRPRGIRSEPSGQHSNCTRPSTAASGA